MPRQLSLPRLPELLGRKIYKTGQTRGADDDVIYQNRVGRNSTVLIPYQFWGSNFSRPDGEEGFENGFIVLIPPRIYFEDRNIEFTLLESGLCLGQHCLVFYETRYDWERYNPDRLGWKPAQNRSNPFDGQYVARVPATTATDGGGRIIRGFNTSKSKGAGIRLYEYASSTTLAKTRLQLEALYWLCYDSLEMATVYGMTDEAAVTRKKLILHECKILGLLDYQELHRARIIDPNNHPMCPLCLERLSGSGFFSRLAQAEGREVPDLTVTEINLFHIDELRYGVYNHKPYNLGWGHHHCNVVVKDSGIVQTLQWMKAVIYKNEAAGFAV